MAVVPVPGCRKKQDDHRHAVCWNCGRENCLSYTLVSYICSCECAETEVWTHQAPERGFDIDFAARTSSPALAHGSNVSLRENG